MFYGLLQPIGMEVGGILTEIMVGALSKNKSGLEGAIFEYEYPHKLGWVNNAFYSLNGGQKIKLFAQGLKNGQR